MEMGFAHCDDVILKESPLPVYAKSLSLSPSFKWMKGFACFINWTVFLHMHKPA